MRRGLSRIYWLSDIDGASRLLLCARLLEADDTPAEFTRVRPLLRRQRLPRSASLGGSLFGNECNATGVERDLIQD